MNIRLLCIGKTQSSYIKEGIAEYEKRLKHYTSFELVSLSLSGKSTSLDAEELRKRESKLLLDSLKPSDHVILLSERGKRYTSVKFAEYMQTQMNAARKQLVFIVGGAFGCSMELEKRADLILSLSDMTLTHDMVRLLFTEQLYRALTILRGEKYHHT